MKPWVKVVAGLAGLAVAAPFMGIGVVYAATSYRFSADLSDRGRLSHIEPTSGDEAVARGKHSYEVLHGCAHCHSADGSGQIVVDDAAIGHIEAANLTKGAGGVLGAYDLDHFGRAVRQGIRREGTAVVFMPSDGYASVSDREIADLWAYLQTLPPRDVTHPPPSPGPLARVLYVAGQMPMLASAYAVDPAYVPPTAPPPSEDLVAYGAHIGAGCRACHRENLGGGPVDGAPPDWPHAPNISPSADGIGDWTEEDFVNTFKTLKNPKGTQLREPMASASLGKYTAEEYHALWTFLRSRPPVPDNPGAGKMVH